MTDDTGEYTNGPSGWLLPCLAARSQPITIVNPTAIASAEDTAGDTAEGTAGDTAVAPAEDTAVENGY